MSFWLRTVLSWLLAAALPMQGAAAATMLHCAEGVMAAAAARAADHPRAAEPAMAAMAHHHHHDAGPAGLPAKTAPRIAAAPSKCSVRAACCIATALPVAIRGFDATAPADSFAPVAAQVDPVFLTDGPERPPRPQPA
jgi:hypothetical protein